MPRIPHDIIFLTGGWHYNHPVSTVQAYDTRADRWIDVPHEDPAGILLSLHASQTVVSHFPIRRTKIFPRFGCRRI